MQCSEDFVELAKALSAAQGQIEDAIKGQTNPAFKSKYADLAALRAVIKEPLKNNNIAVVQAPRFNKGSNTVSVETIIMHTSGQYISEVLEMPLGKTDAHGVGSAITYARRYSLMSMLCIASDDDDGNGAVGNVPVNNGTTRTLKPAALAASTKLEGEKAAKGGFAKLSQWFKDLPPDIRGTIPTDLRTEWVTTARVVDQANEDDKNT